MININYFIPSIDVRSQQYVFQKEKYNYINNKCNVKVPTNKELQKAQVYKDKIPQYKCSTYTSFQGQIKVGVVQDDPAYCSVNYNDEIPPNCVDEY